MSFDLEEKFYSEYRYFSYSGINKLLFSPKLFYRYYILQEREEGIEAHLVEGKLIHLLLLEEEKFHENYIIAMAKLPGDNNRKILDRIFAYDQDLIIAKDMKLIDFKSEILDYLKEINLHQKIKEDDVRLGKVITTETETYWEFLKLKGNRDIIDQQTYDNCKRIAVHIANDPVVGEIIRAKNQKSEQYMECKLENYSFGLKGFIDNLSIDEENKMIVINDFKRTAKTIGQFKETVEYYNYWLQAAIYVRLVRSIAPWWQWKLKFNFVVIDQYEQVYPFEVSEKTLLEWDGKLEEVLKKVEHHYTNRRYDLPYEFLTEKVTL